MCDIVTYLDQNVSIIFINIYFFLIPKCVNTPSPKISQAAKFINTPNLHTTAVGSNPVAATYVIQGFDASDLVEKAISDSKNEDN